MLAGMQRQVHTHGSGQIPRPHAAANHHILRLNFAIGSPHPGDAIAVAKNRFYFRIRKDARTAVPGTLCQRLSDIHRISIAIRGNVDPAVEILCLNQRIPFGNLRYRQHVHFEAKDFCHRRAALELFEAFCRRSDRDRTALTIPRRLTRLCLESTVQLTRVARQLSHVDRGPQLAH